MARNVPSILSLTSAQQQEIETLARQLPAPNGYRWIPVAEVPKLVPEPLAAKFTESLLMWERMPSGVTAIVCNGVRFDPKTAKFDQEPVAIAVYSSGASTGAVAIHHGSWAGRSVEASVPPEGAHLLGTTSLADYYPLSHVPSASSGPLSDLGRTSHDGAYRAAVSQLFPKSV